MWKNININKQNIEVETVKAILIKMPNNSDYKGFAFWYPTKLVRDGRNKNAVSIGYNDEFTFTLKKFGNGKYNKMDVIDEIKISAEEFEEAFGVMDENITSPKKDVTYLKVEEPVKVEKEVEVEECLKNN